MKLRRIFFYVFLSLITFYASICTYMYIFQRNFLYHPYKNNYLRGEKLNAEIKTVNKTLSSMKTFFENPSIKYFYRSGHKIPEQYSWNTFQILAATF